MTMTSGAVLTGATAEQQPARTAVGLVIDLLAHQLGTSVDSTAKIRTAWLTQEIAILDYASAHSAGERESLRAVLLGPSALQLAGFMSLPANNVSEQVAAAVKVVDDQRDKAPAQVAIDDRAASLYLASFGDVITGVTAFQ